MRASRLHWNWIYLIQMQIQRNSLIMASCHMHLRRMVLRITIQEAQRSATHVKTITKSNEFHALIKLNFDISAFLPAWLQYVIIAWAKLGFNVCAINWGALSLEKFNYFAVQQKSVPFVANYTVEVIKRFQNNGMILEKTSVAGHSLGGEMTGLIGGALNGSLGYIYGEQD